MKRLKFSPPSKSLDVAKRPIFLLYPENTKWTTNASNGDTRVGSSKSTRQPTNRKLTDEQEDALPEYVKRMDHVGAGARIEIVERSANQILAQAHGDSSTTPPTVGIHWLQRFRERHEDLLLVKQKSMELDRQVSHDPQAFRRYFQMLEQELSSHGIQASGRGSSENVLIVI